jgi:hypothetical protein
VDSHARGKSHVDHGTCLVKVTPAFFDKAAGEVGGFARAQLQARNDHRARAAIGEHSAVRSDKDVGNRLVVG